MSKKNKPQIPSDSVLRNAWSSVAVSSGLAVTISAWTISDRIGTAKLTGTMPEADGIYLIDQKNRITHMATVNAMLDYFKNLRN